MKNKYLKFVLISSIVVVILATILIKTEEYKEKKESEKNVSKECINLKIRG